jgi:hypothetical protein
MSNQALFMMKELKKQPALALACPIDAYRSECSPDGGV